MIEITPSLLDSLPNTRAFGGKTQKMTKYIPVRGLRQLESKIKLYRKLFEISESAELHITMSVGYVNKENIGCTLSDTTIWKEGDKWMTGGIYGTGDHEILRVGKGWINISQQ